MLSGPDALVTVTLDDPSTDVAVINGQLLYDFPVKLGQTMTFQITAINRGGVWERG